MSTPFLALLLAKVTHRSLLRTTGNLQSIHRCGHSDITEQRSTPGSCVCLSVKS